MRFPMDRRDAHAMAMSRAMVAGAHLSRREFVRTATLGAAMLSTSPTLTQGGDASIPDSAKVFAVHHKDVCPVADEYQPCDPDIVKRIVKEALLRMGIGKDVGEIVRGWCPPGKTPETARVKIKYCGLRGLFPAHAGVVNGVVRLLTAEGGIKPGNIHVYESCEKNFGEDDRPPLIGTPFANGKNREPGVVYSHLNAPMGADMANSNYRQEIRLDLGSNRPMEYTFWLWDALDKDTDILINIPVLKRHYGGFFMTAITLSMKNHFGSVRNAIKLHGLAMGATIAALNMVKPIREKQRLIVVDALYAMYMSGPERGKMKYGINKLLVARDPVAADYVGWGTLNAVGQETLKEEYRPFGEPSEIAFAARNGVGIRGAKWQDHVVAVDLAS